MAGFFHTRDEDHLRAGGAEILGRPSFKRGAKKLSVRARTKTLGRPSFKQTTRIGSVRGRTKTLGQPSFKKGGQKAFRTERRPSAVTAKAVCKVSCGGGTKSSNGQDISKRDEEGSVQGGEQLGRPRMLEFHQHPSHQATLYIRFGKVLPYYW
jgi:hypothetical protein